MKKSFSKIKTKVFPMTGAVVAVIVLLLIFHKNELLNTQAYKISQDCQGVQRMECITGKVLTIVDEKPELTGRIFDDFSNLLKNRIITDDARLFSPPIHYAGMELADLNVSPQQAFKYCSYNFKQGCLHGYMMEYLEKTYGKKPFDSDAKTMVKNFFDSCNFVKNIPMQYNNCIHAVGHEIAAKQGGSLSEVLSWCKASPMDTTSACVSGALMEFSTGKHGNGGHTHDPLSGAARLPCEEVQEEFKSTCYAAQTAYTQYVPGRESFSQTGDYCQTIPEKYRDSCMLGLAEKIFTVSVENLEKSKGICQSFENKNIIGDCEKSAEEIQQIETVL